MRRRGWQRHMPTGHVELNVIPLIDVVFFLLVFYVISTTFNQESAVPIDRPSSSQATVLEHGFVPVAILRSGAVQLGTLVTDAAHLSVGLPAALSQAGTSHVVVIADREVPTGLLLAVMDACTAGGATAVDVAATTPEGIEMPSGASLPQLTVPNVAVARRPASSLGRLAFALAVSVLCNGLLILLVVSITRMHQFRMPQEFPVRHLVQVPPPPPPAEPPPQEEPQEAPQQVLPPLPPLILATPSDLRLALPPPGPADLSLDQLPALMPAFSATLASGPPVSAGAPVAMEFDQPANVTASMAIDRFYPLAARNHGITGSSVISFTVEASGRITDLAIQSSTPPGVFDQALGALVRSLHAQPARSHGVPVSSRVTRNITWTLTQ